MVRLKFSSGCEGCPAEVDIFDGFDIADVGGIPEDAGAVDGIWHRAALKIGVDLCIESGLQFYRLKCPGGDGDRFFSCFLHGE